MRPGNAPTRSTFPRGGGTSWGRATSPRCPPSPPCPPRSPTAPAPRSRSPTSAGSSSPATASPHTLGALGLADKIYAAPEESTSPEGTGAPERFELSQNTGTEGLLSLDGTLFIGDNTRRHGDVAEKFNEAGTAAVVLDDQQPQTGKLQAVADYVGASEAGRELVEIVDGQLESAKETVRDGAGGGTRIIQVTATGAGGQNSVAGAGTPGSEMIETLGFVSIGAESKLRGFSREFSDEGILAAEPDVIVMAESDYEKWGGADGLWEAFPTLRQTPAGESGTVFVMPDRQLRYSGPEFGAGAEALAEAVAELP